MVMGCRMTITREGEHGDNHTIKATGGSDRHWSFKYVISDNRAKYAIAGYAVIQGQNLTIKISTQGKEITVYSNNPAFGRPDVTVEGNEVSFSQGDTYTWDTDKFKFRVKRENDGEDFKEFTATILPK